MGVKVSSMTKRWKVVDAALAADRKGFVSEETSLNQDMVQKLLWDIISTNIHLDEIQNFWAKSLNISSPQWMILMALTDLDHGQGVPVKDVSAKLHVDRSFITVQSKLLESDGFIRRIPSRDDARVVLLSLSAKARRQISDLSARQELLAKFICADLQAPELKDFLGQLALLKAKLEKAAIKLFADI
jgi:DNA-binding MarR family transcriptional regulator